MRHPKVQLSGPQGQFNMEKEKRRIFINTLPSAYSRMAKICDVPQPKIPSVYWRNEFQINNRKC